MKNARWFCSLTVVALFIFSGAGASYHLTTPGENSDEKNAFNPANIGFWTDLETGELATTPITAQDECYIYGKTLQFCKTTSGIFPGCTMHVGDASGTTAGTLNIRSAGIQLTDLRWHCGIVSVGSGNLLLNIGGTAVLDTTSEHDFCFSTATPGGKDWSIGFSASLTASDPDVLLHVLLSQDAKRDARTTSNGGGPIDAQTFLTGDNAAFRGKILVDTFGTLALGHENAAGDPATPRADAIELGDNSRFTVKSGVTLNTARGVLITGDDVRICARTYVNAGVENCSNALLPMPITGTKGFLKDGDGTVSLLDYSAGDIVVTNGTLVFAEGGSFTSNLTVTVHAGATFLQKAWAPGITVDCREGGTYVKNIVLTVPYSAQTGISRPLDFTESAPESLPVSIRLSEKIALPVGEGVQIDLAKLPIDSEWTAADFSDGTVKIYGLPLTALSIETRDDCRMLVLSPHPTAVSLKGFKTDLNGTDDVWSNGSAAQGGWDYLLTNAVDGAKSAFKGDSITFANPGTLPIQLMLRSANSYIGNATVYPGICFYPNIGILFFTFSGSMRIASDGTDNAVLFHSRWATGSKMPIAINLNLNLTGDGNIKFTSFEDKARNAMISGNNTAFTGRIAVGNDADHSDDWSAWDSTKLLFKTPASLGGPRETFRADALLLCEGGYISPTNVVPGDVVTLATPGCGITVESGGIDVPSDVTLVLGEPLYIKKKFFKRGNGLLVFTTNSVLMNGATANVLEGSVRAASDAAVAGFPLLFKADTGIVVSPSESVVNGFTGITVPDEDSFITVTAEGLREGVFTELPICTVPATADDLTNRFKLDPVPNLSAHLEKTPVVVNGVSSVRYTACYGPAGLSVIVR